MSASVKSASTAARRKTTGVRPTARETLRPQEWASGSVLQRVAVTCRCEHDSACQECLEPLCALTWDTWPPIKSMSGLTPARKGAAGKRSTGKR